MRCPFCKVTDKDKVIDSRLTECGAAIRRRRECQACGRRFTTKERVDEEARIFVAKKDGSHHFSTTLEEHNRAVTRYLKPSR